jgi:hypothetical protein
MGAYGGPTPGEAFGPLSAESAVVCNSEEFEILFKLIIKIKIIIIFIDFFFGQKSENLFSN